MCVVETQTSQREETDQNILQRTGTLYKCCQRNTYKRTIPWTCFVTSNISKLTAETYLCAMYPEQI